jgi:hypothetical protein|tara:strand:+ start:251 stop:541 length:291 start_codon:yes stop_codon:yes gene_type:complete
MPAIPVFTKEQLQSANAWAISVGYNRAIEPEPLQDHLNKCEDDTTFPVVYSFIHEHAAGKSVEAHVRCRVILNSEGVGADIDVDADLFNALERVSM